MTTSTMKSKGKSTRTNSASTDAIELLTADHTEVQGLFKQYDALTKDSDGDIDDKVAIARQICQMLIVHATVEEEIFYPAAREALADNGEHMLNEAEVEHGSLYVGSPETVARKLAATVGDLGIQRFNLKMATGPMPVDQIMGSIRLYGESVIPMARDILASRRKT